MPECEDVGVEQLIADRERGEAIPAGCRGAGRAVREGTADGPRQSALLQEPQGLSSREPLPRDWSDD